ncbi:phosphatase PAP2 family protein [Rhodoferax aquaticus]|uniref:Phosphatase PAP2 family protein n=1 Tax=Rhodoferax aquaticus TaxID=2527691 RepID=A0A515EUE1_9BURK|nr:phosphatase PAP2 family protein [Rhodoferax aquaticus]QDL56286.1 phosphatase PAP2 family protein [Rhodoferax aquaticus]
MVEALLALNMWPIVTRLGEIQILAPALLLALWMLRRTPACRTYAWSWMAALAVATVVTTASKIAFFGWGIGIARLDFTGFSGHTMFSAAIYPVLFDVLTSKKSRWQQGLAIGVGVGLAVLIAVSRVAVQAHSISEVLAGLALGLMVSGFAMRNSHLAKLPKKRSLAIAVVAWFAFAPFYAPAAQTHSWVVAASLALSGKSVPFTRHDLLRLMPLSVGFTAK